MRLPPFNPLLRFLLGMVVAMPALLALWWYGARDYLLLLLEFLARPIIEWLWAEQIIGLNSQGQLWMLRTALSPIDNPINLLAIPISTNRFTISFPLLWGVILATPEAGRLKKLVIGSAFLLPFTLLIALLLVQFKLALNINHQPIVTEVPEGTYLLALPYPEHYYYLIAVGRQIALLVLPTLAPLLVWGMLHRRFIRVLLLEGLLARSHQAPLPSDSDGAEQRRPPP